MNEEKPLNKTHKNTVKKQLKSRGLNKATRNRVLRKLFGTAATDKTFKEKTRAGHKQKAKNKKANKQARKSRKGNRK